MPQTSGHLEKSALIFLYNFDREHNLLKLIVKKLSPKITVKNIKNRVFFFFFLVEFNMSSYLSWMPSIVESVGYAAVRSNAEVMWLIRF